MLSTEKQQKMLSGANQYLAVVEGQATDNEVEERRLYALVELWQRPLVYLRGLNRLKLLLNENTYQQQQLAKNLLHFAQTFQQEQALQEGRQEFRRKLAQYPDWDRETQIQKISLRSNGYANNAARIPIERMKNWSKKPKRIKYGDKL